MSKPVVLFLAANPSGTSELALTQECAAITRELRMTPGRTSLDFQTRWAVTVDDLSRELNELEPTLIHFSGHGNAEGIALVDQTGAAYLLTPEALAAIVQVTSESVRAVVLNACYSDEQARVISEQVGCTVGMKGTISDEAAREFSVAFYRAIGHGRSVYNAYRQAKAMLGAKGLERRASPHCLTRPDVDAGEILLRATAEPPPQRPDRATRLEDDDERPSRGNSVVNNTGENIVNAGTLNTQGGTVFDQRRK